MRFRYYGRKLIKISVCNIFIEKDIGYLYHGGGKLTGRVARSKEIPTHTLFFLDFVENLQACRRSNRRPDMTAIFKLHRGIGHMQGGFCLE